MGLYRGPLPNWMSPTWNPEHIHRSLSFRLFPWISSSALLPSWDFPRPLATSPPSWSPWWYWQRFYQSHRIVPRTGYSLEDFQMILWITKDLKAVFCCGTSMQHDIGVSLWNGSQGLWQFDSYAVEFGAVENRLHFNSRPSDYPTTLEFCGRSSRPSIGQDQRG